VCLVVSPQGSSLFISPHLQSAKFPFGKHPLNLHPRVAPTCLVHHAVRRCHPYALPRQRLPIPVQPFLSEQRHRLAQLLSCQPLLLIHLLHLHRSLPDCLRYCLPCRLIQCHSSLSLLCLAVLPQGHYSLTSTSYKR